MSNHPNQPAFTPEQVAALSAFERSVSLAAGAGCGKTFVLTERFLSYLDPRQLEPTAELDELVAITFTDAAAREMRERIRRRCYERYDAAVDPAEREAWQRLLRTLDTARISTIHSFCHGLLRRHAAEAGLDPQLELLDPPTAELLRLEVLDDRLRDLLLHSDERVIELALRFGLAGLRSHLAGLLGTGVQDAFAEWGRATPQELANCWRWFFSERIVPLELEQLLSSDAATALRQVLTTIETSTPKLAEHVATLTALLEELPRSENPQADVVRLRELAKVQGVCTKKQFADPGEFEALRDASKAVRDAIDKSILKQAWDDAEVEDAARAGLDLLALAADVDARYTNAKAQRGVLEFDDLLWQTHRLLVSEEFPGVQRELSSGARLMLVDEFQDTDPLQVAIVKALRGEHWHESGLFVVGDFKQSIYRFRGAEPSVSNELRESLPAESRLSLTTNFRSQPAILDFVNALFAESFAGGYQPLRAHRAQLTATPAVEFLWATGAEAAEEISGRAPTPKDQARAREARFIARRLAELFASEESIVVDPKEGPRPPRPGDVAILLRSLSDVPIYENALREAGLEYYLAGGHAFYAQQEIFDVLHLLRSVASPADELSLAGALRSPLFALADETLFWLVDEHGSLGAALEAEEFPPQLSDAERAKIQRAARILADLRLAKDRLLVAELLRTAIEQTGYDATLLAEFLGYRKLANVEKLVEQARSLDRFSPGDLGTFITQLSEFVVRAPKEPLAATQAESNVVRIMTIHNAKGLEFPLVVVPDLDRNQPAVDSTPVLHRELGPLVPAKEKKSCVGFDLYRYLEQAEATEERLRLLYVACTRAADYLILSSSIEDVERPQHDWLKFLASRFDLASGRLVADIPDDYGRPAVRVTIAEPPPSPLEAQGERGPDIEKLLSKARQLATSGSGELPASVSPVAVDHASRRKYSFSRLSGQLFAVDSQPAVNPAPGGEPAGYDARGFGSLVHAALERVDFSAPGDVVELCGYLAPRFVERDAVGAAAEAATLLTGFLQSERGTGLARAEVARREVEFVLPWPLGGWPERRFLHGLIDCLYRDEAGGWRLLDYKTNRVGAADVPAAAARYEMQMFVYHLAATEALGAPPVETVVHFLKPGIEFHYNFDAASHAHLTAQLDQAIQSLCHPK